MVGGFAVESTQPVVDTRRADTITLVRSGDTVVIGGLKESTLRQQINKIPLLGDLPLIGQLFSNDKEVINHSELLVFISPHIYKGEPLSEQEMRKFKELSEQAILSLPSDGKNDWLRLYDKNSKKTTKPRPKTGSRKSSKLF